MIVQHAYFSSGSLGLGEFSFVLQTPLNSIWSKVCFRFKHNSYGEREVEGGTCEVYSKLF